MRTASPLLFFAAGCRFLKRTGMPASSMPPVMHLHGIHSPSRGQSSKGVVCKGEFPQKCSFCSRSSKKHQGARFWDLLPFALRFLPRMPDHSGKRWNKQLKCKGYSSGMMQSPSRSTKYMFAGKFLTSFSHCNFSFPRLGENKMSRTQFLCFVVCNLPSKATLVRAKQKEAGKGVQTGRRKEQMMIMMIGQQLWLQQQVLLLLCNFVL